MHDQIITLPWPFNDLELLSVTQVLSETETTQTVHCQLFMRASENRDLFCLPVFHKGPLEIPKTGNVQDKPSADSEERVH